MKKIINNIKKMTKNIKKMNNLLQAEIENHELFYYTNKNIYIYIYIII